MLNSLGVMRRINAAGDCAGDSAEESAAAADPCEEPSDGLSLEPLSDAAGPVLLWLASVDIGSCGAHRQSGGTELRESDDNTPRRVAPVEFSPAFQRRDRVV